MAILVALGQALILMPIIHSKAREAGIGTVMRWAGDNKVGEGSMTIVDSLPNEVIRFKLAFLKPFKATNTTEFTFKSEGGQTLVT